MTHDPRLNPMPGDRIRQRGKTIEVVEGDKNRPAIVHCLIDGEPWTMGIFWWQRGAKGAEVIGA